VPLKIAVVGCGRVARNIHLPNLCNIRDVAICALVDPETRQRELAGRICPSARVFSELDEFLEAETVDAVLISAPTAEHARLVTEAVDRGMHVYVEKPLAATVSDASSIVSAWQGRATVGMVGFNYRFHPLHQSARRLLAEGAVGRPLMISTVFSSSASIVNDWRARRGDGGGVLLDLASHHVDLIHFLLQEDVTQVHAQTSSRHAEGDTATLQMRLRNDVLVSSMFSFDSVDQDRVEIFGDRAILRVDRYLSTGCEIIPRAGGSARLGQVWTAMSFLWRPRAILSKLGVPGNDPTYRIALEHFVESVRTGTPCAPDFNEGYRALQVISAAEQSAREGRWVDVTAAGGAN
jgi:myo-inositol 2-dehydrogenase / D-chiro-inositol 1-dehydrogenase